MNTVQSIVEHAFLHFLVCINKETVLLIDLTGTILGMNCRDYVRSRLCQVEGNHARDGHLLLRENKLLVVPNLVRSTLRRRQTRYNTPREGTTGWRLGATYVRTYLSRCVTAGAESKSLLPYMSMNWLECCEFLVY